MEDKDVGKIWVSVLASGMKLPEDTEVVKGLIRKLVEERAYRYNFESHLVSYHQAMRDFGIDRRD